MNPRLSVKFHVENNLEVLMRKISLMADFIMRLFMLERLK